MTLSTIQIIFISSTLLLRPLHAEADQPALEHEMEVFLDAIVRTQMHENRIPGAALSLVHNHELVVSKGYGFADKDEGIAVDPGQTLFRVASISKLFVWTAVMQLVEQGRLDLNADINTYLTHFQIPSTYPEPITMKSLMSHTAGFEESFLNAYRQDLVNVPPLHEVIAERLPKRVRPVDETTSYSNHGAAIAACIVEQVSGLSWEDYVQKNIFVPLGMSNTTFLQPLPEDMKRHASKGYRYGGTGPIEQRFITARLAAAGSASTTATDMAKFMLAHLRDGELNGSRILKKETARLMHSRSFSNAKTVNGMAHGFKEMDRNGRRIIGHGGNLVWFKSALFLMPQSGTGLFLSFNSDRGYPAYQHVFDEFVDYFFPPSEGSGPPDGESRGPQKGSGPPDGESRGPQPELAGFYSSNRVSHTDLTKGSLLMGAFEIVQPAPEIIVTKGYKTSKWRKIGPLLFQDENSANKLTFRQNSDGGISHVFFDDRPHVGYERLAFVEQPGSVVVLLAFFCVLLVVRGLGLRVIALIKREEYSTTRGRITPLPGISRYMTAATVLLLVAFLVPLAVLASDRVWLLFGVPTSSRFLFVLPVIACVTTALHVIAGLWAWTRSRGHLIARLNHSFWSIFFVMVLMDLYYWNALGFRFGPAF